MARYFTGWVDAALKYCNLRREMWAYKLLRNKLSQPAARLERDIKKKKEKKKRAMKTNNKILTISDKKKPPAGESK